MNIDDIREDTVINMIRELHPYVVSSWPATKTKHGAFNRMVDHHHDDTGCHHRISCSQDRLRLSPESSASSSSPDVMEPENSNKCHDDSDSDSPVKELHIAPMIHASTLEFRLLMRILSKRCVLWTEMVVDETLYHNCDLSNHTVPLHLLDSMLLSTTDRSTSSSSPTPEADDDIQYHYNVPHVMVADHPVVCQIGGIRPEWTAVATQLMVASGYQYELNLNLDCPSSRVQGKRFGAVLMKDVETTVALIQAMHENCGNDTVNVASSSFIPQLSIKCRIGIGEIDGSCTDYEWIQDLIERLTTATVCRRFILHARPVVLQGLSPAQNRLVPPLNYPIVYQLCRRFPSCTFILNGGIAGLQAAKDIAYGVAVDAAATGSISRLCDEETVYRKPDVRLKVGTVPCHDAKHASSHQQGYVVHAVPCLLCRKSNGSCIAPPSSFDQVPPNLRGCMVGRAALDHPMQFWDVDRYWYGAATNPVSCRRHVLDQYCAVLRQLYPRRCCDDDDMVTDRLPAPIVRSIRSICHHCGNGVDEKHDSFRQCNDDDGTVVAAGKDADNMPVTLPTPLASRTSTVATTTPTPCRVKISTRVVDRSLKPVLNMFCHQPGAKAFRRAIEALSRDTRIRNCGPAHILRQAVAQSISDAVLDEPLVRTEDLLPGDIVEHTCPLLDCRGESTGA
jgi:tRNA-dihydrouridine synthase A